MPSSRYCTGVYLLNCPWFSCFLTRYSAGKQARQLHPLTDATWVLQDASIVMISANQSLCSIVDTEQTYMDFCMFVYSKFARFAQNLHVVCTFTTPPFFPRKKAGWYVNSV